MDTSPSATLPSRRSALLCALRRGAWFGAKFTFWLLVAMVAAPISIIVLGQALAHPAAWKSFSLVNFVRIAIPVVFVPVAGAVLGAAVAAVLFPLASLLSHRSPSEPRGTDIKPASPFDDLPATPRTREELLRRIVRTTPGALD